MKKIYFIFISCFLLPVFSIAQNKNLEYFINSSVTNSPKALEYSNLILANSIDSQLLAAGNRFQISGSGNAYYAPVFNGYGYDVTITNGQQLSALVALNKAIYNKKNLSLRFKSLQLSSVSLRISSAISMQDIKKGIIFQYITTYGDQLQLDFNILIASSLLVFLVILFLFRDVRVALAILIIAVLGISGSYLALFITGTPLNVGSYTGLIMIVGIIGENSIFTFLQFKENLLLQPVDESIEYAISTRLRPKLMTAIGAIIALMPLALGIGAGAELHQPLAIAVIGGFIIALPLLLMVLPSVLRWLYTNKQKEIAAE